MGRGISVSLGAFKNIGSIQGSTVFEGHNYYGR